MSEYVVEVEYDTLNGTFSQKRREEIVRCRDCEHMHVVRQWTGVDMPECWLHAGPDSSALGKELTEPYGFCAWGERRDA